MTNLLNELTTEDKKLIDAYITNYATKGVPHAGVDKILSVWAKNKTKLFHWLGDKLRVQIPFENTDYIEQQLKNRVYTSIRQDGKDAVSEFYHSIADFCRGINNKDGVEKYPHMVANKVQPDLKDLHAPFYSFDDPTDEDLKNLKNFIYTIADYSNLYSNKLELYSICDKKKITIVVDGKTYQFQDGEKIWKSLKKLITAFPELATKEQYEKARILYSMWLNDKKKGYLTISIHPLDFMTMSDNNSKWHSCMSWMQDGCYRSGSVEMMNSNNVFCVYYTSSKDDKGFVFDKKNGYEWNNKVWRGLVIATKEIIVSNKAYPYCSESTNKAAIAKIKELAETNMGYSYEFGPEKYDDMTHIYTDYYLDNVSTSISFNDEKSKRKQILFRTNGMYNDMLENDTNYEYWCYRNKVKKKKLISYSGKSECMNCGKINYLEEDDYYCEGSRNYLNAGTLLCPECLDAHSCPNCGGYAGNRIKKIKVEGRRRTVCNDCGSSYIMCPFCQNEAVVAAGFFSTSHSYNEDPAKYRYDLDSLIVIPDDKMDIVKTADLFAKDKIETFDAARFFDTKVFDKTETFALCCHNCYNKIKELSFVHSIDKIKMSSWYSKSYSVAPALVITESDMKEHFPNVPESAYIESDVENIFGQMININRNCSW